MIVFGNCSTVNSAHWSLARRDDQGYSPVLARISLRSGFVVIIERLEARSHSEWDAYVQGRGDSTCYHLREWQAIAENAYRLKTPFLVARKEKQGPVSGILPLFVVRGFLRRHVTNGLFGSYGGILSDDQESRDALVKEAQRIFNSERADHLMLKCLDEPDLSVCWGLEPVDSWVIATLAIEPNPEKVWHGFKDKIRNSVRKARRFDFVVKVGPEYLRDFYDVLAENMHSKGAPIYGLPFMAELTRVMGDRAEIVTLWLGKTPVSGALVVYHRDAAYVPFASSRPWALHMCPNNLLYWELIRRACERGMRLFDFGRSIKGSGPLAFKLSWGAEVRPQRSYVCSVPGKSIKIDPKDRRVDWFVRQWCRLPRTVVNTFGPSICRQLAGLI